jgi:hypothetical protein
LDISIPSHREFGGFKNRKNGKWWTLGRALASYGRGAHAQRNQSDAGSGRARRGWYREIRPGVYELVTTMRPAPPPKTFTREELMRKFGFTR